MLRSSSCLTARRAWEERSTTRVLIPRSRESKTDAMRSKFVSSALAVCQTRGERTVSGKRYTLSCIAVRSPFFAVKNASPKAIIGQMLAEHTVVRCEPSACLPSSERSMGDFRLPLMRTKAAEIRSHAKPEFRSSAINLSSRRRVRNYSAH